MAGANKKRLAKERKAGKTGSSSEEKSPKSSSPTNSHSNLSPPAGVDGNRDPSAPRSRSGSNASQGTAVADGRPTGGQAAVTGLSFTTYRNLDLGAAASGSMAGYGINKGLPPRPKQANKTGRETNITLNSFQIQAFPTKAVYQYDIIIGNGAEKRGLIRTVWESKTLQDAFKAKGETWIFDGNKIAWADGGPPNQFRTRVNLDLDYNRPARKDKQGNEKPADIVSVSITRTKQLKFDSLRGYLSGQSDWSVEVLETINFLDHLMREQPSKSFTPIKRMFFARGQQRVPLGMGVEAFKGVYESVRPVHLAAGQAAGLGVNVDVANTTFWSEWPLHMTAKDICGARDGNHLSQLLKAGQGAGDKDPKFALLKRLRKVRVYMKHLGSVEESKKKPLTVKGFLNKTAAQHTFKKETNGVEKEISIAQYFKDTYKVRLQFPDLPLVQMTKESIVMPMELCFILENQRYMFKLNERQTSEMIKFAVTVPDVRWGHIMEGLKMLNWDQDRYLASYGLRINQQPTKVKARVLPNPKVLFHQRSRENPVDPRTSGRWDLRGKVFLEPHKNPLKSWGVCILTSGRFSATKEQVQQFLSTFMSVFKGHGGQITQERPVIIESRDPAKAVEELWNAAGNQASLAPQLLVFVVPDKDSVNYMRIKKSCECRYGVVSQVMQAAHVQKNQQQYCSNVCMKVNAKLGGVTARAVGIKGQGSWFTKPTMVLGADVSHGAPGGDAASIAAITMSADQQCLRYVAGVETNGSRVEMITTANIDNVLKPMVRKWVEHVAKGNPPEHIIYVRDGVSEGQYPHVLNQEVTDIRKMIQAEYPKARPQMTVIIASKRHHIRFFPDKGSGDRNNNPLPGTLVDSGVTCPFEYDFYLCAHSAIKGTARPVHYHVLLDEANMGVEQLQNWLYESSYQFVRSTTPVSLFPAAYYAHLASGRAIAHLDQQTVSSGQGGTVTGTSPRDAIDIKPLLPMPATHGIQGRMWYV